jgi:oxygen-independent coproporphyrinogen-3 oxidase
MSVGLYIHVPFCRARCHFCAFYLEIHREDRVRLYLDALAREIRLHAERNSLVERSLATVYFGGGTPTTLDPDQLRAVLLLIRRSFGLEGDAEVTLEAHPDSVTEDGLRSLLQSGFNRISFGAQSMDAGELLRVGRRTSSAVTGAATQLARRAGFTNVNLDLIYGLPGQTRQSWKATLQDALSLAPTHLSCYALTVEEKSKLHVDLKRGDGIEPDQELQNWMEDEAASTLETAGFERYEISNYSRPGYACRHNLHYWTGQDYLGLGPSAQSYLNGSRFGIVDDLDAYVRTVAEGRLPVTQWESLTPAQRHREAVIFGLRLIKGVDRKALKDTDPDGEWMRAVDRLMEQGLLEGRMGRLSLTDQGRRYADSVAVELL